VDGWPGSVVLTFPAAVVPAAHLLPGGEELAAARRMPVARIQPANGDG
jgi:hypothetical protein